MTAHVNILRCVPDFPYYSADTFGFPQRSIRCGDGVESILVLGPPLHLYEYQPLKSCTVHISGIPQWANMSDVVLAFEGFGKLFTIELSVTYRSQKRNAVPVTNGCALVTFVTYDGAQKALDSHLTRYIPGMTTPLSIYKATVSNVVLLKNLPFKTPKSEILAHINGYPGLLSVSFVKSNVARMVFGDLDSALLFMDVVSSGGLVIDKFTCTVEPEVKEEESDSDD